MISLIQLTNAVVPLVARPWSVSPAELRGTSIRPVPRSASTTCTGKRYALTGTYHQIAQIAQHASFAQMTRIAPNGGGALGSHPARDPV